VDFNVDIQKEQMMDQKITRRTAVAGMLAGAAVLCLHKPGAFAQEATPATSSAPVTPAIPGYPVLNVNVTDSAIEVSVNPIPAGYVLLNVTNSSKDETGAGILGPGEGQTMDDLMAAAATPPADPEGFPPFLYTATILGGPGSVQPGQSAQALLHVPAGDWVVFPEGNQQPAPIKAVESPDSNTTAPAVALTLTLGDFYFGGLDSVATGSQIWEVTNEGAQPHMVDIAKVPEGTTIDQLMATIMTVDAGTPTAGALTMDQIQDLSGGVILLSKGQTTYLPVTFEEGTYAVLCFVTDPATGKPHAMEGMINIFTTGGAAATPTS
jgi:hypothetical protein